MTATAQALAEAVVNGMLERDAYSRWLGIEVLEIAPGRSTCRMKVRAEMVNGFGVCHGGVTFALADSAFAFAANTNGNVTVAVDANIGFPAPVREGDELTAVAVEQSVGRRLRFYAVEVRNQEGTLVGTFRGTVYRTDRRHDAAAGMEGVDA